MRQRWIQVAASAICSASFLFLCQPAQASLYERIGGAPTATKMMDDFVDIVAGDPRVSAYFVGADLPGTKKLLVEQFTAAAGGPGTYTGKQIAAMHKGPGMTQAEFNALIGDLVGAMNRSHVGFHAQLRVLAILTPIGNVVATR